VSPCGPGGPVGPGGPTIDGGVGGVPFEMLGTTGTLTGTLGTTGLLITR